MRPSVALVAAGAQGNSAVGSRIGAFARELGRRGWEVTVIDPVSLSATVADRLFSYTPTALRSMLESAGIEGDVRPTVGWCAGRALRVVATDVAGVSVPPFSLLAATALTLYPRVPLVLTVQPLNGHPCSV